MRTPLSVLLLLIVLPATAGSDLSTCATIVADAARLACYDALAGRVPPQPVAEPAQPPADATASFGAEQLPAPVDDDKGPDLIESTLPGSFRGWNKDSMFELANGQVWHCIECRDVYYVRENPTVTIKRNFLGSYWLKVEGLNQQARVRRVK